MSDMQTRYEKAVLELEKVGQSHVFTYWNELDEAQQAALLAEVEGVDWREVARLVESHVKRTPEVKLPEDIEPAPYLPHFPEGELFYQYDEAWGIGENLIRDGKVAAFTVAGGQGTRLGWDAPKGTFPATPIRQRPLFGVFAEYILKAQAKWNAAIPWYIMTSPINHQATCEFFEQNDYFNLDPANVMIFPQAMMPALDAKTGKVLLAERGRLALSPNGHGGSLKALHTSGAIADMKKRGVEQISYTQVDNPIVKVIDPQFIGLHAQNNAEMSSKMLHKSHPQEKVGNFCLVNGRVTVIEYSDLPDELAEQRLDNGELRFRCGSIAIHVMTVDFVESLNTAAQGFSLPFHRAEKKVPYIDVATGKRVEPTTPNAVKLETFVFDALPLCDTSVIFETDRVEEFAPIKNADAFDADGVLTSTDCPTSSMMIQTERAANWLEEVGVAIPRDENDDVDAVIELTPLAAIEPDDLDDLDLPKQIERGSEVVI